MYVLTRYDLFSKANKFDTVIYSLHLTWVNKVTSNRGTSASSKWCSTVANIFTGWIQRVGWFWRFLETFFFFFLRHYTSRTTKIKSRCWLLAIIAMATHQNLGQPLQAEKVPKLMLTQDFKAFVNRLQCATAFIGSCLWRMFACLRRSARSDKSIFIRQM